MHSLRRPQCLLVRQCEIGCALVLQESERSLKQHSAALASRQKSLWNEEVQQRSRCYAAQSHRSSLLDRQKLKANSSRLIWVICFAAQIDLDVPATEVFELLSECGFGTKVPRRNRTKGQKGVLLHADVADVIRLCCYVP